MESSVNLFISYAREDADTAHLLVKKLRAANISYFLDTEHLEPGGDWGSVWPEYLRNSEVLILLFSRHSNVSKHVHDELALAREGEKKIIPISWSEVAPCNFIHGKTLRLQWIKTRPVDLEHDLQKVVDRLVNTVTKTKVKHGSRRVPARSKQRETELTDLSESTNPYEFATPATAVTFKGRGSEIQALMGALEDGTHTAIFGLQRMGKSSLLAAGLQEGLAQRPKLAARLLPVRIDLQGMGSDKIRYRDIVDRIVLALGDEVSRTGLANDRDVRGPMNALMSPSSYDRGDRAEYFDRFSRLLHLLADASRRRIVLIIDEFSELRKVVLNSSHPTRSLARVAAPDMLVDVQFMVNLSAMMKNAELKKRVTFVIVVRPFMAEFDAQLGLQVLKLMKPITIGYLDQQSARALVTEPVEGTFEYADGVVDFLVDSTAGHPYLIQFILNNAIAKARHAGDRVIRLDQVEAIEDEMVANTDYEAQFNVIISDYSVDEVTHEKEAELGRGAMALISRFGERDPDGWVPKSEIVEALLSFKLPENKIASLLSQLSRTKIIEERAGSAKLSYRITVPLLRRRLVKQNFYQKYFG